MYGACVRCGLFVCAWFRVQSRYQDESFVLPALIRFGGEPVVDEGSGALMYRFPNLQVSGVTQVRGRGLGGGVVGSGS